MVSIKSNITSLQVQRRLAQGVNTFTTTMERLASGSRINRASDDAAGIGIVSGLNSEARVYRRGIQNVNDVISAHNIAHGSLTELRNITTRITELAEQAANGTYSLKQRRALDIEARALHSEYNRIVDSAKFNGRGLLNGDYVGLTAQAGFGTDESLSTSIGSSIQRYEGEGTFNASLSMTIGSASTDFSTHIADFNHDGQNDILATSEGSSSRIFFGNGNGSFSAPRTVSTSTTTGMRGTIIVNVNNDGNQDLIGNSTVSDKFVWMLGNSDGTFAAARSLDVLINSSFSIPTPGDLNGDGFTDFVIADATPTEFQVIMNKGDGTFHPTVTVSGGGPTISQTMGIGDYNGDGRADLIQTSGGALAIRLGNGDGTFASVLTTSISMGSFGVFHSFDFNGDGHLDVGGTSSTTLAVTLGNGDGTFRALITTPTTGGNYQGASLTDFNGDGFVDVIATRTGGAAEVFLGNGNGTFSHSDSIAAAGGGYTVATGDLNGDDVSDFAAITGDTVIIQFMKSHLTSHLEPVNLLTASSARSVLNLMDKVGERLGREITTIGSNLSRMNAVTSYLTVSSEQRTTAAGRIQDADIASESANLTRAQIFQNVAASVLAQANLQPQLALTLLRDA